MPLYSRSVIGTHRGWDGLKSPCPVARAWWNIVDRESRHSACALVRKVDVMDEDRRGPGDHVVRVQVADGEVVGRRVGVEQVDAGLVRGRDAAGSCQGNERGG